MTVALPSSRQDCVKLRYLLDTGKIRVGDLSHVAIEHQVRCPMRDPRKTECTCDPHIWIVGEEVGW